MRDDVVDHRNVSISAARDIYGVVLTADGKLDEAATTKLRSERRSARCKPNAVKLSGKVSAQVTVNLSLRKESDGLHYACTKCATDLGHARGNYKDGCVLETADISASNPNIGDWKRYIDDRPEFRQFFCPGCGSLIENEIAREGEELLRDIELTVK